MVKIKQDCSPLHAQSIVGQRAGCPFVPSRGLWEGGESKVYLFSVKRVKRDAHPHAAPVSHLFPLFLSICVLPPSSHIHPGHPDLCKQYPNYPSRSSRISQRSYHHLIIPVPTKTIPPPHPITFSMLSTQTPSYRIIRTIPSMPSPGRHTGCWRLVGHGCGKT